MYANVVTGQTVTNNIAPKLGGSSTTATTGPPTSFSTAATAITTSAYLLYGYTT
jgi:hypothetical protein